jgi:hypothetical protein
MKGLMESSMGRKAVARISEEAHHKRSGCSGTCESAIITAFELDLGG